MALLGFRPVELTTGLGMMGYGIAFLLSLAVAARDALGMSANIRLKAMTKEFVTRIFMIFSNS